MNTIYKVYNDGSHFVGTKYIKYINSTPIDDKKSYVSEFPTFRKKGNSIKDKNVLDEFFDVVYERSFNEDIRNRKERLDFILNAFKEEFKEDIDFNSSLGSIETMIIEKVKIKCKNLKERVKRFKRKAYLNDFNYFVTITYDDKLHTEDSFRKKLKKCFSNLAYEKDYKYMGVFEKSPTGRLHFHALMYIPKGKMVGEIETIKDYNFDSKKMVEAQQNTFFLKRFGRNDFKPINSKQLKKDNTLDYLIKYIGKSNEKVFYSRGLNTFVYVKIEDEEESIIICSFSDMPFKYIFFNDVLERGEQVQLKLRC